MFHTEGDLQQCPDFFTPFFPVEVKWPCDNEEVASFPLQMINTNRDNCTAGLGMLGKRISPVGHATTQVFSGKKKSSKGYCTGPMSRVDRLKFPVVKIEFCDS